MIFIKTKNNIKKVLAFILAFSLIISSSLIAVSAEEIESKRGKIDYYNELDADYTAVYERIAEGAANFEKSINLYDLQIPKKDIWHIMNVFYNSHPELFWLNPQGSSIYFNSSQIILSLELSYYYDKETAESYSEQLKNKVDEIFSHITPDMSDLRKAIIIHDEIVKICKYNLNPADNSIYGCLVNGEAKCMGYARSYSYLLSLQGIDSEIISSESMNHDWNKICIDGNYYNVDVTWDDPTNGDPGYVIHDYFLYSDNAFISSKRHNDYLSVNAADSTKYDYYFLHNLKTALCFVENDCYAIDNSFTDGNYSERLLKYNPEDDSYTVVKTFNEVWWAIKNTSFWLSGYMCLDEKDGLLYYNTSDKIYSYNPKTGEEKVVAENTYENDFYGMYIVGNDIYAYVAEKPLSTDGKCVVVATCPSEQKPDGIMGDFDGSGTLDVTDVTILQRHLARSVILSDEALKLADINNDGEVNVSDVTSLQYIIAGSKK